MYSHGEAKQATSALRLMKGAAMALCSDDARTTLERIRRRCEYIELSSNAYFNDVFVEEMAM